MSKEYEHTPRKMAEKLIEFNRDFSDSETDISEETTYLEEIFEKLQKSDEFEILAHHLDEMFADPVFEEGRKYLDIYREDYAPGQFREILRILDVSDSQAGDGFMLACNVVRSTLTKRNIKINYWKCFVITEKIILQNQTRNCTEYVIMNVMKDIMMCRHIAKMKQKKS